MTSHYSVSKCENKQDQITAGAEVADCSEAFGWCQHQPAV